MSWRVPQKNTNVSRRQEFFRRWTVSRSGTLCLSHYVTETSHFWRHFSSCKAATHSDCWFFCAVYKYYFLLTYLKTTGQIFMEISPEMHLWSRKNWLIFCIHQPLRPDVGIFGCFFSERGHFSTVSLMSLSKSDPIVLWNFATDVALYKKVPF